MKTRRIWTAVFTALLMAVFGMGCKDELVGIVGTCPVVASTDPAAGATSVAVNKVITVTFNTPMNPLSITPGALTVLSPGSPGGRSSGASAVEISGTPTYNASNYTMSFTPGTKLADNATYTGTVATTVKDITGNALQEAYVWTFATGSTLSPTVVSTEPVNNATGVFINKVIKATFSVPMDPLTFTSTTFLINQGTTPVTGVVTFAGNTARFTPSSPLTPSTLYTATITTGAKSAVGTPLAADYTWSFTTGTTTGPSVDPTDPADLETNVDGTKP